MRNFEVGLAERGIAGYPESGTVSANRAKRTARQRRRAFKKELQSLLDQYERKFQITGPDDEVTAEQAAQVTGAVTRLAKKWRIQ